MRVDPNTSHSEGLERATANHLVQDERLHLQDDDFGLAMKDSQELRQICTQSPLLEKNK